MTTILIKKKDTAGAPAPGDLTNAAGGAEIAVNTATKRIYTKDSGGTVVEVGTNPSALTTNLLFSPDATYDIGASGATRPRNLFLSGAATLGTALTVPNGGTGLTTLATGSLSYGAGTSAFSTLAIGTAGQILTVNSGATAPQWSTLSGVAVTTFSAGTTGFTPSSATAGAVTLAGTLATTNGGTGLTSFTSGGVVYASSSSALATGSALTFNGSTLAITGAASLTGDITQSSTSARITYSNATTSGNGGLQNNTGGAYVLLYPSTHSTKPNHADIAGASAVNLVVGGNIATATSAGLAVTGTLGVSGLITSTIGNNAKIFSSASATTGYQYMQIQNTSGILLFGLEGSSGGSLLTNGTAYATVLTSVNSQPVEIGVNQTKIGSFSTTGLAVTGKIEIATSSNFPTVGFTYNSNGYLYTMGGSAGTLTQIGGVNRFAINSSGLFGFGSTGVSGDRLMDMSFSGATTAGATQFGIVLNPTYPTTPTTSIYNIYAGPNLTSGTTVTSVFGLYLEAGNYTGCTVTNKWALYQAGSNDSNYFAGKVGIGTTTFNNAIFAVGTVNDATAGNQSGWFSGTKSAYAGVTGLPQGQLAVMDQGTAVGAGGAISFMTPQGSGATWGASIMASKVVAGTGDYGCDLVFFTRPSGSTADSRGRFTSGGAFLVGQAAGAYPPTSTADTFMGGLALNPNYRTAANSANCYWEASTGAFFRSTSSLRYKTNIVDYGRGLQDVMNLRAVSFNSINGSDKDKVFAGFIAEEIHALGLTEFVEYDGENIPDSVGYSQITALLTKAIQELNAKFDAYVASHP